MVEAYLPEETTFLKLKPNTKSSEPHLAACRMIQICNLRRGCPGEVRDFPEWRGEGCEDKGKATGVWRKDRVTRKEKNAPGKKTKDPKDPSSLQWELPSRKENYPRSKESCSKGLEGTELQAHEGPRIAAVLTSQNEELPNTWSIR